MDVLFNLDGEQLLQFLLGTVLPIVVGFVTTRVTAPRVQAILLLALSFVTSLGTELLTAINEAAVFDLGHALVAGITTFVIGVATHYGLWKPTGVTAKALDSGVKAKP